MKEDIDYTEEFGNLQDTDVEETTTFSEIRDHRVIIVIPNDERRTSSEIQLAEMTEAVGIRASQIENNSPIYTNIGDISNPIDIAWKEFIDRENPLIIQRPISETSTHIYVEQWEVRKMGFSNIDTSRFETQNITKKKWVNSFNYRLKDHQY